MGSQDKFYGIQTASHGFDDIGYLQPSGSISSVARYGGPGKWRKMAGITAGAAHTLKPGQAVNIMGTTDYDGPTIVLAVPSTTTFVIKRPFTITKTGTWDCKAGEGNWDAMMPIGTSIAVSNMALTFWKPNMQGGNSTATEYAKDQLYTFPGGIRRAIMSTAGTAASHNARFFRAASLRPGAVRSLIGPVVMGYNPTGAATSAAVGTSIDILGSYFDPALSNNVVKFYDGATAVIAYPSSIDQEGHVITVPIPSGAGATGVITVKINGFATATGPAFNIT